MEKQNQSIFCDQRIYSGKRKDYKLVCADIASYMHTLNQTKMEEMLYGGEEEFKERGCYKHPTLL